MLPGAAPGCPGWISGQLEPLGALRNWPHPSRSQQFGKHGSNKGCQEHDAQQLHPNAGSSWSTLELHISRLLVTYFSFKPPCYVLLLPGHVFFPCCCSPPCPQSLPFPVPRLMVCLLLASYHGGGSDCTVLPHSGCCCCPHVMKGVRRPA